MPDNGKWNAATSSDALIQVQVQMWCAGYSWTDFFVRTVSTHNNFHAERIQFDTEFINNLKPKLYTFFVQGILKELETRSVQTNVRDRFFGKIVESVLCRVEESVKLNPSASNVTCTYPCGFCAEECGSNPREDSRNSLGCDVCFRWFHYSCVGVTGEEAFLKKRKSVLKCASCISQTKGRKRLRQSKLRKQ